MGVEYTSKILIIDSNENDLMILSGMLEDRYEVRCIDNATACVDVVEDLEPDVVIMDPTMKGLDVDKVCELIREKKPDCYLVFLSPVISLEETIRAYEHGADDFIGKPYNVMEIDAKLKIQIENRRLQLGLMEAKNLATETAYSAMESSAELGVIIRFMESIGDCTSYDDLGVSLLAACEEYNVTPVIQIRGHHGTLNFRCSNDSVESYLLKSSGEKGKFVEGRGKLIINNPAISVLLRGVPALDDPSYCRIKDNITVMLNVSEARIKSLSFEIEIEEERELGLAETMNVATNSMTEIKAYFSEYERIVTAKVTAFQHTLQNITLSLSLDEDQEEVLMESLDQFLEEVQENGEIKKLIDNKFSELINRLGELRLG